MPRVVLAIVCVLTAGCSDHRSDEGDVEQVINDLKVAALMDRVDRLEAHIPRDYGTFRVSKDRESWFATGPLTVRVRLDAISGDSGGSIAQIEILNLMAADQNDCSLEVNWGQTDSKGAFIHSTVRSEVRRLPPLASGEYKSASIELPGMPPKKIGRITLSEIRCYNF